MSDKRKKNGKAPGMQCQAILEDGKRCQKTRAMEIEVVGDGVMVRAKVCERCGDGKVVAVGR